MKRTIYIDSYFSIPTDLAGEFRSWPEFVSGSGYQVRMRSSSGESVAIRYLETEDAPRMTVESIGDGELFERVLGRALYALSAHSDTVCIRRVPDEPNGAPEPTAPSGRGSA